MVPILRPISSPGSAHVVVFLGPSWRDRFRPPFLLFELTAETSRLREAGHMATRWEAASAVAIALAVMGRPAAAQDRPIYMTIVVQDLAGLSPAVIRQAETVVTRIYSQIGVQITWREIVGFEEPTAIEQAADVVHGESTIHVGLLSAEMEHRARPERGRLGMALSGTRLVRVFVNRVEHVARSAQEDMADVLGHVMAHEIGHVLLGPDAHSTAGLMAARLDLPRLALGALWFDRAQAAIIQARLACDGVPRLRC
jgi:hypothetical protein